MPFGDMRFNGKIFETGICRCHGWGDLVLNSQGDIDVVTDEEECITQRIIIWMGTHKGERLDPTIGCVIHDYMHKPITSQNMKHLRSDALYQLQSIFPDYDVKIDLVINQDEDQRNKVTMYAWIGKFEVSLRVDKEGFKELYEQVRTTLREMGFGAVWKET